MRTSEDQKARIRLEYADNDTDIAGRSHQYTSFDLLMCFLPYYVSPASAIFVCVVSCYSPIGPPRTYSALSVEEGAICHV